MKLALQPPPALDTLTVTHVSTELAAFYLDRSPQTLRTWACKGRGPIKPGNSNGRLHWPVDKIREVLSGAQ